MDTPERLRRNTLRLERNSMRDDTASQREGMARAKRWQDSEAEKIFNGASGPAPNEAILSSSGSWPRSSMSVTSPEDVYARARSKAEEQEEQEDEAAGLRELGLEPMGGAADAQPRTMEFYAGRNFAEGRKLHNAYLVSRGQAPIPEGRK
jgi:hypothetical protein